MYNIIYHTTQLQMNGHIFLYNLDKHVHHGQFQLSCGINKYMLTSEDEHRENMSFLNIGILTYLFISCMLIVLFSFYSFLTHCIPSIIS